MKVNIKKETVKKIIRIDSLLKQYHREKKRNIKEENLSEASINEDYFFALFYLKEDILGKELNYTEELLQSKQNNEVNKK